MCQPLPPVRSQGHGCVERPTMDAFWRALGDLRHDDLAFERAEDDEAKLG